MELIGLEFLRYAGLKSQFIPLTNRVQMLAGRNNAGKTALLQAIAHFAKHGNYRDYRETEENRFAIYVRDGNPPEVPIAFDWQRRPEHFECVLRAEVVLQPNGQPVLVSLDAIKPDGYSYPVLYQEKEGLTRTDYRLSSGRLLAQGSNLARFTQTGSIWNATQPLWESEYIDPHREIEQSVPVAENTKLPVDGAGLASFLDTMQNSDHARHARIEQTFLECFPEYWKLLTPMTNTTVSVVLLEKETNRRVPLTQCGTGVEQMLIMIVCILGAPNRRLFLMDDPQDFLHPFLERKLMQIIEDSDHSFIIATHSATLLNSVEANQVTYIEKPGRDYISLLKGTAQTGEMLRHLGYRNSDILFYESVLFVEGQSDKELLPLLFAKASTNSWKRLRDTCICELGGTSDYRNFDDLEKDVIVQEKLIQALHRSGLPHLYLLDGDKSISESRISAMRPAGAQLAYAFLKRSELENYLIDPEAITAAINGERIELGIEERVSVVDVQEKVIEFMYSSRESNPKLFKYLYKKAPKPGTELAAVQGSRLLERIFEHFTMAYNKRRTGARIIDHLKLDEEAAEELSSTILDISARLAPAEQ